MQRRIFLLRRSPGASQAVFAAAAIAAARELAHGAPGAELSIDLFGTNPQAGPADAVIYVANALNAMVAKDAALEVTGVLRVETRSSVG